MAGLLDYDVFKSRIQRTREALKDAGIPVAILSSFGDARYLTGLDGLPEVRPIFLVLTLTGRVAFAAPVIEANIIRKKVSPEIADVAIEWGEWDRQGMAKEFHEALSGLINKVAPYEMVIGLDYALPKKDFELLRQTFYGKTIKNVSEVVLSVRSTKDHAMTKIVGLGAEVAKAKLAGIQGACKPGVPEWQAALAGFNEGVKTAADILKGDINSSPLFNSLIVMGSGRRRSADAHSVASGRVMRDGEIAQVCCCTPPLLGHGMCFDRPVKIGTRSLPLDVMRIIEAAREAQEAALAAIRPGVTVGFVHDAAMAVIRRYGYEAGMQHGTGRAICCADTAIPRIMADDETIIKRGDIFGVEPGVYVKGAGGARFGDTVHVIEDGYEPITDLAFGRYFWTQAS